MPDEPSIQSEKLEPMPLKITKDKKSGLPVAVVEELDTVDAGDFEPDDSEFSGTYQYKRDNLVYALAIVPLDIRGRTYHARNTLRRWSGTKAEFEDQFVKV